jgi:hypothetical protein
MPKIQDNVVAKATAALAQSVASIIGDDDCDDATRAYELAATFTEFQDYLDRNVVGDVVEKADRGGAHDLAGALIRHLGDRLERRREAHGYTKREEFDVDTLTSIMKDGSIATTCAAIVAKGSTSFSEHQLVEAVTKVAHDRHPELSPAQAFSKVATAATDEARVLRDAINVAKAAGPMFDVTIVHPGDETRRTVNDTEQSEAYQTLEALASKLHEAATGKMTKEQAFARAFESRPDLAAKAHRRPTPPAGGAYPFPR